MDFLKGYNKRVLLPIILLPSTMLLFTIFGEKGLLRAYRLRKELWEIRKANVELEQESERLREEIKRLGDKNDRRYIEQLAREELGLVKKGEIVFQSEQET